MDRESHRIITSLHRRGFVVIAERIANKLARFIIDFAPAAGSWNKKMKRWRPPFIVMSKCLDQDILSHKDRNSYIFTQ